MNLSKIARSIRNPSKGGENTNMSKKKCESAECEERDVILPPETNSAYESRGAK